MTTIRVLMKICVEAEDNLDPRHEVWEVELPAGYRRVWRGALKPGDLHLHCTASSPGAAVWVPVRLPSPEEVRRDDPYSKADWIACVIRPGEGEVDRTCERCQVEGVRRSCDRYCEDCVPIVVAQGRRENLHAY